jgi:hypothetical protein
MQVCLAILNFLVRCYCNEKTSEQLLRASNVLDRLECFHTEQPTAVRITGAVCKAVIDAWGYTGGQGTAEHAEHVLKRMEQQGFACKHRVTLTWHVYAGVMKASSKHPLQQAERLAAS